LIAEIYEEQNLKIWWMDNIYEIPGQLKSIIMESFWFVSANIFQINPYL
jgi:hypothetical protein